MRGRAWGCRIGGLAARLLWGVGRWRVLLLGLGLLLLLLEALHDWWDLSAAGWIGKLLGGGTVDGGVVDGCSEFLGLVVGGLWAVVDWLVCVCWGLLGLLVGGTAGRCAVARIGGLGGWGVARLLSAVVRRCTGMQWLSVCLVVRYAGIVDRQRSQTLRARAKVAVGISLWRWRSLGKPGRIPVRRLTRSSIWCLPRLCHRRLQKRLIITSRLDELLVQLGKFVWYVSASKTCYPRNCPISPFFCEYFPINSINLGRIAKVEWYSVVISSLSCAFGPALRVLSSVNNFSTFLI